MMNKESTDPNNWVDLYADYLFSFAMVRLRDDDLAKDLVQDTFLSALKNQKEYKKESSVRTWLTAILKNKIIDQYRKKSSLRISLAGTSITENIDDFFEENGHWKRQHYPEPWTIEGNNVMETSEFQNILKFCLEKLPNLWASVFSLKHMEEEESDKICKDLKLSSSNFWVIMHRTKLSLRACMEKNWL